jgi:hypothetical protein
MSEVRTYWICRCGTSNHGDARRCTECKARRPRHWGWYIAGGLVVLLAISALVPEDPKVAVDLRAPEQVQFEAAVKDAARRWGAAPNPAAAREALAARDRTLISMLEAEGVDGWTVKVLAVPAMSDGAGLLVSSGSAEFAAGVYLTAGLDTLIRRGSDLYERLMLLHAGDIVRISGRAERIGGSLAELSYGVQSAANTPRFLFRFTAIEPMSQ